ncbi:MAG: gliding motility-associated C-terminal domain-containing protein [Elusimicrobia bacterium]|nr:gliding motility-associated C-terminal domain-containing protein [Candidatus Obscuribacterium magneticum]
MTYPRTLIALTLAALVGVGTTLPLTAGQSLGGITLNEVAPRVITPNNDLFNDVVFFRFDTPLSGLPVETAVYDINGAKVGALTVDASETALKWDGKDDSNVVVPAGIYIYSIKIGKSRATGTVVVAR